MKKMLLAAAAASMVLSLPAVAAEDSAAEEKAAAKWAELCDSNKDGMVSKAEVMAQVEKAWNKADAGKKGMLDMKQLSVFLKSFDPGKIGGQ